MALTAFVVGAVVIFILIIEACTPEGPKTYIPRKQRPPPQESVAQSILRSFSSTHGQAREDDPQHESPKELPTSETMDLRPTHEAEETSTCIARPGHQHDLNLVQPRGLHSSFSQAIRLRFARPDAGRRGISLHHKLRG